MYLAEGVGIAAPQVGLLKRAFIVDIGEGAIEFVNPEIITVEGEHSQTSFYSCQGQCLT